MSLLQINDLVVGYGSRTLFRNLSFSISEPSLLVIVGHNGSGKTSLFKAIQGQVPYDGSVSINGRSTTEIVAAERSALLTVLEQHNTLTFPIAVIDLVVMGRFRHRGFLEQYTESDKELSLKSLGALGIDHLADRDMLTLSGGEQQLVWLAQLMVQDSAIMLLDEPTQQLDLYNRKKVFDLIRKWTEKSGKIVVCITHDLHELIGLQGALINMSSSEPRPIPLTKKSVLETIDVLQEAPPKVWSQ